MPTNLGIIGTGGIAENALAPAVNQAKGARLWSVLSRDQKRGEQFAARHKAASKTPAYNDISRMLKDPELDGVIIATPDKLHGAQALQALRAGKHVLVEKPMCTDPETANEMVACAKEMQRCLAVAYHLRWHAGHRAVREQIANGLIGRIVHTRALWPWKAADGSNWRASQDLAEWWSLSGVGTHCLDLVRWFMTPTCGEVKRVGATLSTGKWNSPHDELALVQLKFESGATGEFCSTVLFDAPSRLEIYGDAGFVICEGTFGRAGAGRIITNKGEFNFSVQNPFVGEIENFAQAITKGIPPEVDGSEGKRNVELLTEAVRVSGLTISPP